MKYLFSLVILISFNLSAQLKFSDKDYWSVLSQAKEGGKLVMVYAYTDWCEPCEEMEEYTFTDLEVANQFNKNFLILPMDMETYPGVELAEQFTVGAFPSFLFLDASGRVVHRGCGAMDASEFLYLANQALSDSLTLLSFEKRYELGEREVDFMLDYLQLLDDACLDAERFAKNYLKTVNDENLVKETAWEVLASYQWDIYSREFQFLLKNRPRFEEAYGSKAINAKIYDTYLSQYQEVFEAEELHDFGMRALLHAMKDVKFVGADTLQLMMNLHYAEFSEKWDSYANYAIELVGMLDMTDPEELNELAWKFYLFVENKNQLEIAASWSKQAVDELPIPSTIDTYASLQYKLGNKKRAIELEEKALELAQELMDDTTHYEHQLAKFSGKK